MEYRHIKKLPLTDSCSLKVTVFGWLLLKSKSCWWIFRTWWMRQQRSEIRQTVWVMSGKSECHHSSLLLSIVNTSNVCEQLLTQPSKWLRGDTILGLFIACLSGSECIEGVRRFLFPPTLSLAIKTVLFILLTVSRRGRERILDFVSDKPESKSLSKVQAPNPNREFVLWAASKILWASTPP